MKKLTIEELFKDYKGGNPHREFDFGEPVGRERIWTMTDEEYNNEYGESDKDLEESLVIDIDPEELIKKDD